MSRATQPKRLHRTALTLTPLAGVTRDGGDPGAFRCAGAEPTCTLHAPEGVALPGGWVYLEGHCERRGAELFATLIVMDSAGDEQRISIPMTRSGAIKHVVRLPDDVAALRWVPLVGDGKFRQRDLVATRLGTAERVLRMASWTAYDLWKLRGTRAAADAAVTWSRVVEDVEGAYADTAKLRVHAPRVLEKTLAERDARAVQDAVLDARRRLADHRAAGHAVPSIGVVVDASRANDADLARAMKSIAAQSMAPAHVLVLHTKSDADAPLGTAAMSAASLVALVDARDSILSEYAVELLMDAALQSPEAELVTGDEVYTNDAGERVHARRRGVAWNPERVEATMHAGALVALRGDAFAAVMPLSDLGTGATIFATTLRLQECSPSLDVAHVPHALAHTTASLEARSNEHLQALCAVLARHHAETTGARIDEGLTAYTTRVAYPLPPEKPRVTVLIPTRDALDVLRTSVESVLTKTAYANVEVVVLDNQSRDAATLRYLRTLEESGRARVLPYDAPFNYSAMNNLGVRETRGELLAFLNNDIEVVHGDWLEELVSQALRPEVGAVGAKLLYPDGFVQHAGVVIGVGGVADHAFRLYPGDHPGPEGRLVVAQQCSAVTGACLVLRRDVFERVGGFDEVSLPVAFNDVDLCLKVRAQGLRVVWTPHARLVHHESYSRGSDHATWSKRRRAAREMAVMRARWHTASTRDPFAPDEK